MNRKALVILPALALAVSLAACSGSDSGDEASAGGGGSTGDVGREGVVESPLTTVDEAAADATAAPLPGFGPRIIQTASLRLSVRRGSFDQAVEEARSVAAGAGGFVVQSSESRDPGQKLTTGTLVLRVPQTAYANVMRRLGDIGRIGGRQESGQDVSAEFVDLEARRRHLEAVETQLLKLLNRAEDVAAALAVQAKLDDVQLRLEEVRGRLRYLDDQTAFATISLALRERAPVGGSKGDDNGGVLDAWADGASAFAHVAGRTFVVLATIAPVVLLLAVLALAVGIAYRRGFVPRRGAHDRA
jgi:Domain of unknown function (DUF4349)